MFDIFEMGGEGLLFADIQEDRTDEQAPDDMVSLGEWLNNQSEGD